MYMCLNIHIYINIHTYIYIYIWQCAFHSATLVNQLSGGKPDSPEVVPKAVGSVVGPERTNWCTTRVGYDSPRRRADS